MPLRRWVDSANNAIEGILYAAKTQKHVRYHLFSAAAILILCTVLGVERVDFMIVSIAVILVLLAEMLNTAFEYVVDMLSPEYTEKARVAKDIAAGAVLITAFGAAVLGFTILFPYFDKLFTQGMFQPLHSEEEVIVTSIIVVLILVIILKTYYGKGQPLRGGKPSGHAAVSFSAWVAITYITADLMVSLLCFMLATLIAQSRVSVKVHSPSEVVLGALLGSGVTFLLFYFLY